MRVQSLPTSPSKGVDILVDLFRRQVPVVRSQIFRDVGLRWSKLPEKPKRAQQQRDFQPVLHVVSCDTRWAIGMGSAPATDVAPIE